ncbi:MAG: phage tail protein [Sulfuricurvum sp.]|nr:phage tail protein [Sulfuricurvum sp.]
MNFGINGSISVDAARPVTVESTTPIAIVATTDAGTIGLQFFGNAELALAAYEAATTGTLKNALNAIIAQGVRCPIILNTADDLATEADIIAAVNELSTAEAVTGYRPNLIICPEHSGTATIGAAMDAIATRLWATAIIDVTAITETAALAYAGNFGSRFCLLVGPETVKVGVVDMAPSAVYAGMIAAMDASNPFGWAESASNRIAKGVSATNRIIDYADGQDSEARRLRNAGIASIVRDVGWRSYGFETTDIDPIWEPLNRVRSFYKMLRAMIEASKWARDRQADELLYVKQSVEEFMRGLKGAGVVLGFEAYFDPEKNTKTTVTNGQFYLTVEVQDMPTIRELNIELVYVDNYSDVLLNIING